MLKLRNTILKSTYYVKIDNHEVKDQNYETKSKLTY